MWWRLNIINSKRGTEISINGHQWSTFFFELMPKSYHPFLSQIKSQLLSNKSQIIVFICKLQFSWLPLKWHWIWTFSFQSRIKSWEKHSFCDVDLGSVPELLIVSRWFHQQTEFARMSWHYGCSNSNIFWSILRSPWPCCIRSWVLSFILDFVNSRWENQSHHKKLSITSYHMIFFRRWSLSQLD